jgi:hypothetical protein
MASWAILSRGTDEKNKLLRIMCAMYIARYRCRSVLYMHILKPECVSKYIYMLQELREVNKIFLTDS